MEWNWVKLRNRALPEYRQGIKDFLDFAFEHATMGDKIFVCVSNAITILQRLEMMLRLISSLLVFSLIILDGLDMVRRDILKPVIVWIVLMNQMVMA